ncbi:hypothetical protein ACSSS7_006441 [Eimeria intestinalis]
MKGNRWGPPTGRGRVSCILRYLLCLWCFTEGAAAFQLKGASLSFWVSPVKQGPLEVFIQPHNWAHTREARAPWKSQPPASPRGLNTLGPHASHIQVRPSRLCVVSASDSLAPEEEEEEDSALRLRENSTQTEDSFRGKPSRDFSWGTRKQAPLMEVKAENKYDVEAQVKGGGLGGQSGAIMLAVARELCRQQPHLRPVLKRAGFLTVDSRRVERKKFGLKKARKRPQYSKR